MPTDSSTTAADAGRAHDRFAMIQPIRVRWAEADLQGVVFNAHYMTYFDVAITEYWRVLAQGDAGLLQQIYERLFVVKSTIEFHAPARFDDQLAVGVRCARLGRSSMTFDFEIRRGTATLVSAQSVYVNAVEGRSVPLPDDLKRRIHGFEIVPPL